MKNLSQPEKDCKYQFVGVGPGERGQPGVGGEETVGGSPGPMSKLDIDGGLLMGDEEPQPTRKRL